MLLLCCTFSIYAQEDIEKKDISIKELIKKSSVETEEDEEVEEDIEDEEEEVAYIRPEQIAVEEDEEEVEYIRPEQIAVEDEEELEEDIEIFIAPKEEPPKFNFIAWLKKILGIKEVEEEISYIEPEEIIIEEEEEEIGKVTEIGEEGEIISIRPGEIQEEITSKEGAKVIIVKETDVVNLIPKAYDPDKDLLKYTFTTPLNKDGKWQTNYGDSGEYTITITASDGELSSSKEILIIVNRKEEAPSIDLFEPGEATIEANEDSIVEFTARASDLNNDRLSYDWKLDGEEVSSDQEYTYTITFDDAGSHTMKLTVSDDELESTKLWSIKVNNVNRLPILEKISDIAIKETDTIRISPEATDPDGDEIKFTISEPVGNTGVWETTYDDSGEYVIKVTASDGIDSTSQDIKITIENVNRAPIITDILQR
jgi:PKD repeat protein